MEYWSRILVWIGSLEGNFRVTENSIQTMLVNFLQNIKTVLDMGVNLSISAVYILVYPIQRSIYFKRG